jgi:hypothetical protein
MTTGEGGDARDGNRDDRDRRADRISIGGGDDSVTRIQLAARWAESYAPTSDSLAGMLKRFKVAFDYLDAVIHGVEPPELERDAAEARGPVPAYSAPVSPESAPQPPPPAPQAEPRPWG